MLGGGVEQPRKDLWTLVNQPLPSSMLAILLTAFFAWIADQIFGDGDHALAKAVAGITLLVLAAS